MRYICYHTKYTINSSLLYDQPISHFLIIIHKWIHLSCIKWIHLSCIKWSAYMFHHKKNLKKKNAYTCFINIFSPDEFFFDKTQLIFLLIICAIYLSTMLALIRFNLIWRIITIKDWNEIPSHTVKIYHINIYIQIQPYKFW